MYAKRPTSDPIADHAGPYERWIFSQELGRPFSFPAIASGISTHFTALLDRPGDLPTKTGLDIRIPPLWTTDPLVTPFAMHDPVAMRVHTVQSQDAMLSDMLARLGKGPYRVNMPVAAETWPADYDPDAALDGWQPPQTCPRAIVGVIDDGIPFAHRAFLKSDGTTRMACCWLQAARADGHAAIPFGRELTNAQIDALRLQYGTDEPALYRTAGAVEAALPELGSILMNHMTHGSHIMGLAAGNGPQMAAEPLPDDILLIAVQLPNTIAWDTSGFGKETTMLSAVEYVFHRARAIAAYYGQDELPLALNFSYGWSASGHDGGTAFETAVENLLTERRKIQPATALVMPTGNNFEDDMHGRIMARDFAAGHHEIGWHHPPDDRTSSYLELWFPPAFDTTGWEITLVPPSGTGIAPTTLDIGPNGNGQTVYREVELGSRNIGQLSADDQRHGRRRFIAALIPTAQRPGQRRRTPSGGWTLRIKPGATPLAPDQSLDIWLQRDDDPVQLATGGRQSRLVPLTPPAVIWKKPKEPLPTVRGFGSLNGIGNSPSTIRVAGRVQTTDRPAAYSGARQLRQDDDGTLTLTGVGPTVDAISDQGPFRPGLPSIGTLSGCSARIIGTSAASAAVTRMIALNMAAGDQIQAGMKKHPKTDDMREAARRGDVKVPPVCSTRKIGSF
ncbi:MAG: hypothetical protein AAGF30_12240 [Pseudomonadota bacterium]